MLTYIIFFTALGVIISIVMGINLSSNITDPVLYFLFWMMFIITIGTIVNIGLTMYYYNVMKNKTGPRGPRGDQGEQGEPGEVGECSIECRTGICTNGILEHIIKVVSAEEAKDGVPIDDRLTMSNFKNVFIKERLKTICQSPEYAQFAPYKGEQNLINYLKTIWGDIAVLLYKRGGSAYFKSVGAENSWDWVDENPWNEFKKYDIYYWGLGNEYRPIIKEKCDSPGDRTFAAKISDNKFPNTLNMLGLTTNKVYKEPSKRDSKYSILSYVNIPTTVDNSKEGVDGMSTWVDVRGKSNGMTDLRLYNANSFTPAPEVLKQYVADTKLGKNTKLPGLKPMSYLVANPNNPDMCAKSTLGGIKYRQCNPYDPQQIFQMKFTGDKDSKLKEFRIRNQSTGKYLGANRRQLINVAGGQNAADIFTFG